MHQGRRTGGRRRRVLYTSHHADSSSSTAASRRDAAKLREARRAPSAYGSRVRRRLRGRWFSLVPVRRRTLTIASTVIVSITLLLCLAHYFAVTRPWLAYHPEVARPLRLDRPDSFGHWIICILLAGCSGTSLLIYQLRRHRNDDYRGQYRLWRLVLVLLMIASVHSLVGLVDWGGALLDGVLGKRVALNGNDWLRLVVGIGSAILALRLIAEVRRSRWALTWLMAACVFLAIPETVNWNMMAVETIGRWTLVTSAPILGCTALFLSLIGYLRMLLRQVRRIEDDSIADKFQELKTRIFRRRRDDQDAYEEDEQPRRRWFAFGSRTAAAESEYEESEYEEEEYEEEEDQEYEEDEYEDEQYEEDDYEADEDEAVDEEQLDEEPDLNRRRKRRWFGLRAARNEADEESPSEPEAEPTEAETPQKRRAWSLRLKPTNRQTNAEQEPEEPAEETEESEQPKRRFGLSWRRKPAADRQEESEPDPQPQPSTASPESDQDFIDPDEIDWDSLSKSERRRLRKQIKRQRRVA